MKNLPGISGRFFMYNTSMIAGIDEVGRGPWAGPLVVGVAVLGADKIPGLTDSKKLSKLQREKLHDVIIASDAAVGLGWVLASEIDTIGLAASLRLGSKRALQQITVPYHEIIIDGTVNFLKDTAKGQYVTTLKKADLLISAVSAAAIVAKVSRDRYMASLDQIYDGYNFTSHVGYGTAAHRSAIESYGITDEHRRSFAPIAAYVNSAPVDVSLKTTSIHTSRVSESVAANWLVAQGYRIDQLNWRTKFCEIDVGAKKSNTIHFIEVKHRRTAAQGGGLAAITPQKLRQMRFAASLYLTKYPGVNARLGAISTVEVNNTAQVDTLVFIE
jgi:ribonuclease HII